MNKNNNNKNKINTKQIVTWLGRILMIVSFVLIVVKVIQYDVNFSALLSPVVDIALISMSIIYGLNIFAASVNFRWFLSVLYKSVGKIERAVPVYCSSNLYKYLPGNIMHFVGRNQLAVETEGLSHADVAFATVAETLFLFLGAFIITIITTFNDFIVYIKQAVIPKSLFIILAIIIAVVIIIILIFRKPIFKLIKKYAEIIKSLRPSLVIYFIAFSCVRLLILALTYFVVLAAMGQPLSFAIAPRIIGIFVMSWMVGFAIPGAPGGLGVREAIMMMFLGGVLNQDILISSAIFHRIVCILGDVFAYLISIIYSRVKSRRENNNIKN